MKARFGIYGLGLVGSNLARNALGKGLSLALYNRGAARREAFAAGVPEAAAALHPDPAVFVAALAAPRIILLSISAGPAVDEALASLLPHLEAGDLVADAGDSFYRDSERRSVALAEAGIAFVGLGLSGGAEGALTGPSFMAGGDEASRLRLSPILEALAAISPDGGPCVSWTGPAEAGHYVKMVHNSLAYADLEILAEAYHLLKASLRVKPEEMRSLFERWERTEVSSHLLALVVDILGMREADGQPFIDRVLDRATQKGTGIRAIESAFELGAQAATLAEAVFARNLTALKDERVRASALLGEHRSRPNGDPEGLGEDVRRSMLASKIIAYAEGFTLLGKAAESHGWRLDRHAIARAWRAGAMIRSPFIDRVAEAHALDPELPSLLLDARMKILLDQSLPSLRRVVARSIESGLPLPLYTAAVCSYDGQRSSWLPGNLIQALRDRFGGHGFERVDRPRGEIHHAAWELPG